MFPQMDLTETRDSSQPREKAPRLRVLIVDDEPLIRWSLRHGFAARGHAVSTASNGVEAMAELRAAGPFDVAILDYRLPDRHDLSLLEDVRRMSPGSLVVMMTAFADDGMKTEAQARGAHTVVDKPFQIRSLVDMVEAAVVA
jgi:DNA-binding NtrC family response regulator